MCPEEDYSAVVKMLTFDVIIWVGIEETKNHDYQPTERFPERVHECTHHYYFRTILYMASTLLYRQRPFKVYHLTKRYNFLILCKLFIWTEHE